MKTLRRFLRLAAPFWLARRQWREWLLLAAVVGFALAIIRIGVWLNAWDKVFYNALARFDGAAMPALLLQCLGYITMLVICVACGNWLRKRLLLRWREHLTRQLCAQWLDSHRHWRLQLAGEPDNPDQRIAEDAFLLAEQSIDLFKYFIMNAARLGAFVTILWRISGVQHLTLAGHTIAVHGYLVWLALAYSVISTLITHWIGHRLQELNVERQHREADYRAALLGVREHAEQIAFYSGEAAEQQHLAQRFARIKRNWLALIARELKLESFTAAHLRVSIFIPIFAALPLYLSRAIDFGSLMQSRSAFANVLDGFGWFMDYYKRLIEWAAVVQRLAAFQDALNDIPDIQTTPSPADEAGDTPHTHAELHIDGLTLHTATGRCLLRGVHLHAHAPQWLLLQGASGIGKSTLLRTLAGLWPYYEGHFAWRGASALFLPQRPYLPHGSLRATASYPHAPISDDGAIRAALAQVGLERLATQLDAELDWHRTLSGGEAQRLSLARALLHRPQLLFLDEATNQLDEAAALALMRLLREALPHTLCVGVSHQPGVQALFDHSLQLQAFQPAETAHTPCNYISSPAT